MPVFRLDFTGYGSANINLGSMKQLVYYTNAKTKKEALRNILFKHMRPTANALYAKLVPYVKDIVTEAPRKQRTMEQMKLFDSTKHRMDKRAMAYLADEQKAMYMENSKKGGEPYCPFCRTEILPEIQDGPDERINDNTIIQIWLCMECDEAWTDVMVPVDGKLMIVDVEYTEEDLNNGGIMMSSTLKNELVAVANDLDGKGVFEEAGMIDQILQAFKSNDKETLIKKVAQIAQNDQDVISISPALLLRFMEYAKEEAADDVTLHKVLENIMAQEGTVISRDYETLLPKDEPEGSSGPEGEVEGRLIPEEEFQGEESEPNEMGGNNEDGGYSYQVNSDSEGGQQVSIQGEGNIEDIVQTLREVADTLDTKGNFAEASLVDGFIHKISKK